MADPKKTKPIAKNAFASREYHLHDRAEAGLVLLGTEVKAAREGKMNLRDSYVGMRGEEAFLMNAHIGPYSHEGSATHEPLRPRKLLLHKKELRKLRGKLTQKGYTLIPLQVYAVRGRLKVEIALAVGKKLHDKRESLHKKEAEREIRRRMAERN